MGEPNVINESLPKANSLILVCKLHPVDVVVGLDHSQSLAVKVLGATRWRKVRVEARNLGNLENKFKERDFNSRMCQRWPVSSFLHASCLVAADLR